MAVKGRYACAFSFWWKKHFLEKLEKYVKYTSYNIKILNLCSGYKIQ